MGLMMMNLKNSDDRLTHEGGVSVKLKLNMYLVREVEVDIENLAVANNYEYFQ